MNHVFAWPVGQGGGFSSRMRHAVFYSLAALAGGASLGAFVAIVTLGLRTIPTSILLPGATTIAFMAACLQVTGKMGWFPERKAQVPDTWLLLNPMTYSLAFGGMLGLGVLTFLHHAVWYSLFAAIVVQGDPSLAIVAGTLFGLVRGSVPLVSRLILRSPSEAEAARRLLAGHRFGLLVRLVLVAAGFLLVLGIASQG